MNAEVPILGFVASSGTGKTTLLVKLIPVLKENGLRVGIIKHSHHDFEIDRPGKDSYRFRQAGASPVMLVSRHRRAVVHELCPDREPRLHEQLSHLDGAELDLILVEGFSAESFPKIELHRASRGQPLLYPGDPDIIAIATDEALETPAELTQLDINRPDLIAEFIQSHRMRFHV